MRFIFFQLIISFTSLVIACESKAAEPLSPWVHNEFADIRLISSLSGTQGRLEIILGLEFRLASGWKVYWRSSGEVGYPPKVTWEGSDNLTGSEILYPLPQRFSFFGLETFGYKDHVVYPIIVHLTNEMAPLKLKAHVKALVCNKICMPIENTLFLNLPNVLASSTRFTYLLNRWLARVPRDMPSIGLEVLSVQAFADNPIPTLTVTVNSIQPIKKLDIFPEGPNGVYYGKPNIVLSHSAKVATVHFPVKIKNNIQLVGSNLRLTITEGDRFVERNVIVTSGSMSNSFWRVLGAALLGGLLLNFMPCVLPVISLKLFALLQCSGAERREIRLGFLASAGGIIILFIFFGGLLVGLKIIGLTVGWGIHFQQPLFLASMISILLLFAVNLWGWFEFTVPRFLAKLDENTGTQKTHCRISLIKNFFTGIFAALLATPCSVPFLGTAVGFALAQGRIVEILFIFLFIGIGLALPYLLVSAIPSIAYIFPRPGIWLIVFRRILALGLLATIVWLLSVLAGHIEQIWTFVISTLLITAILLFALLHYFFDSKHSTSFAFVLLVMIPALVSVLPAPKNIAKESFDSLTYTRNLIHWKPFNLSEIDRLVKDGLLVFVNVTADWCLGCKVNKSLIIEVDPILSLLTHRRVIAMEADWSKSDPKIAEYLASFGRYGIPFNAVYGSLAPGGILLPELLSASAIKKAIDQASGLKSD
ncbi:cytochrome c biogenesis protein [Candidatus Endolissoclinum faulkneri L5]|uniref:Cytochrome c biogenesis protein n=1 Tax=Candidatus Endolissoclinum faulkneri L5 TaxID=1401328 RepID=V9TS47_9PROT|nr:protein-disulfide reductase DsbD domain-containing protein [Candidatus Endolissoclinum faulkneri]AHC73406.1 cytochrome c biogenesis protein [Candidatus Endolissoclinum faulkneri L5]